MEILGLQSFLATARPLLDRSVVVEFAVIAVKNGADWHLLRGRVVAWPWSQDTIPPMTVKLGDVVAVRSVGGRRELDAFVAGLPDAQLNMPAWEEVKAPELPRQAQQAPSFNPNTWRDRTEGARDVGLDWPFHHASLSTGFDQSNRDAVEHARRVMASTSPPHADEADLLSSFGFHTRRGGNGLRDAHLEFVVPVPARVRDVRREGDQLQVDVEHAPNRKTPIAVAVIREGGAVADRHLRILEPLDGKPGPIACTTVTLNAPQSAGPVRVIVSYDNHACDERLTGNADGRAAVHQAFDSELRWLRMFLDPDQGDKTLEPGLAMLFHALGFASCHYGLSQFNHAPDVVAFHGDRRVLVCECSWTPPDVSMIDKAKQRAAAVKEALRSVGKDAIVVPVVVTAGDYEADPISPLDPREQGVALLTQSDLTRFVTSALHGEGPEALWRELVDRTRPVEDFMRESLRLGRRMRDPRDY